MGSGPGQNVGSALAKTALVRVEGAWNDVNTENCGARTPGSVAAPPATDDP